MNIIESKVIRTVVTKRIEIDRKTLLQFFTPHFDCGDIPGDAAIFVQVPGGGDWSNTSLSIEDAPINITWIEVTHDEE